MIIIFIIHIKERKTVVTQTYQIITKQTQHRKKLSIYNDYSHIHIQIHYTAMHSHTYIFMFYS